MSAPLFITDRIWIPAPAKEVWDMLTNPEQTPKYMFGCRTVSDWKIGSPLLWQGEMEGKPWVFVKGKILQLEPKKKLVYTVIDPHGGLADIDENYLEVSYRLSEENGGTLLEVSQGDYTKVGDGPKRYEHSLAGGGWKPILDAIRNLMEPASGA